MSHGRRGGYGFGLSLASHGLMMMDAGGINGGFEE